MSLLLLLIVCDYDDVDVVACVLVFDDHCW